MAEVVGVVDRERDVIRRQVKKLKDKFEEEFAKEGHDRVKLTTWVIQIEKYQHKLEESDAQHLAAMTGAEGVSEEELDKEVEGAENYMGIIYSVLIRYYERYPRETAAEDQQSTVGASSTVSSAAGSMVKLPKKEIPKFDGKLVNYLSWRNAFEVVHSHPQLSDKQKFDFLMDAVADCKEAKACVSVFQLTGDNYPKAMEALKERFGNDDVIGQALVMDILDIVAGSNKLSIVELYDTVQGKLQSLESMGRKLKADSLILYPMIARCLPEELRLLWERHASKFKSENPASTSSQLEQLMDWLKEEVRFKYNMDMTSDRVKVQEKIPTAAHLFSGVQQRAKTRCFFCKRSNHASTNCFDAKKMTLELKKTKLARAKACFICFKLGHQAGNCRSDVWCSDCKQKHNQLMCPRVSGKSRRDKVEDGRSQQSQKSSGSKKRKIVRTIVNDQANPSHRDQEEEEEEVPQKITRTIANNINNIDMCMEEVPLQTLRVIVEAPNGLKKIVRAMIDSGTQRTTLLRNVAQELQMVPTKKLKFQHKTYGDNSFIRTQNQYPVRVWNLEGEHGVKMNVLDDVKMITGIPDVKKFFNKARGKSVMLTDIAGPGEIELLIGNDVKGLIVTGEKKTIQEGLVAFNTTLGWVLSGSFDSDNDIVLISASLLNQCSLSMLFDLEVLGIKDPAETKSKKEIDEETKGMFLKTLRIDHEGRYEIRLPAVISLDNLANNFTQAKIRLESMTTKLKAKGYYETYGKVFDEWIAAGIIEEVPTSEYMKSAAYYQPHRAVVKETSATTKVRPVFDASAKTSTKLSLNDCLAKGPNMLELIPALIIKFRLRKIAATSDIAKAFLQISVCPDDRDYLRFLWYDASGNLKMYRHRRVVFGVNSSPFQLAAVIEYHLNNIQDERRHWAKQLLSHLYVDNCIISLDNEAEYMEFKRVATELLSEAKMDLRLWTSNIDGAQMEEDQLPTVLGLSWNQNLDSLQLKLNQIEVPKSVTKRIILSYTNAVFDPMGFVAPVTLLPKLLLRQLEFKKYNWDDEVPEEINKQFLKWVDQLKHLKTIEVARPVATVNPGTGDWHLHVFVDASKDAYAVVVYLRVQVRENVTVRLIQAKARVAPKDVSIPRLELMGGVCGARIATTIQQAMVDDGVEVPVTFWTDSKTVLTWIKKEDAWGVFVHNRVKEIRKLTSVKDWRFINGVHNPADLPSRGCNAQQLWKTQWLDGPKWLYLPEEKWPKSENVESEEALKERRKTTVSNINVCGSNERPWYLPFNSFNKNLRVIAYVRRWRKRALGQRSQPLDIEDLEGAEMTICRLVQEEAGVPDCEARLALKQDRKTNLWYVKSRTILSSNPKMLAKPIYLPKGHMVVDQIIRKVHHETTHAIGTVTINKIREKYWVKGLKKTVRDAIRKCFGCRKYFAQKLDCPYALLPRDRVTLSRPFEVIGVDLGGHMLLNTGDKCWFVLFTDAVYRGIHLELVTSLSTEAFIMAFRRYISRRGRPKTVYSDNGTNFVGTNNLMEAIDWKKIEDFAVCERIRWKFNPPTAAWWGGWWERMVKVVKDLLKRNLGNTSLNHDQLATLMCDIEAVINARPISYMSEDPDDLVAVTPEMFYKFPGTQGHQTADLDVIESSMLRQEYQERQQVFEELKSRFTNDYLSELLEFQKRVKGHELKVGDIVLIEVDNVKRQNWKTARVEELLPGRDGICRAARLRIKIGDKMATTVRPYQRLYPLEMELPSATLEGEGTVGASSSLEAEELESTVGAPAKRKKVSGRSKRVRRVKAKSESPTAEDLQAPVQTTTRSGRHVRKPQRYLVDSLYKCIIE